MAPPGAHRAHIARAVLAAVVALAATAACTPVSTARDIRDPYLERLRALSNEAIDVIAEIDGGFRRGLSSEELLLVALADIRAPQRLAVVADKVGSLDPPPGFAADQDVVSAAFRRLRDAGRDLDAAIAERDVGAAVASLVVLRDIIRQTAISVTPETCGAVTPGGGYELCDPPPEDPWKASVFRALLPIAARYDVLAAGHAALPISDEARSEAVAELHPTVIDLLDTSLGLLSSAAPPPDRAVEQEVLVAYLSDLRDLESSALAALSGPGGVAEFDRIRAAVAPATCAVAASLSTEVRSLGSGWFDDCAVTAAPALRSR